MKKTLKNLLYVGIISTLASCGTVKNLNFEQVDKFTSDTYAQPYAQVSDMRELALTQGKGDLDNQGDSTYLYQILAKGVVDFKPADKKGNETDKVKKVKGINMQQRVPVDTLDIVFSFKETKQIKSKTDKKSAPAYVTISGTNLYNEDYIEMYKIPIGDDNKLSTNPNEWLVKTSSIKSNTESGFIPYTKLNDELQASVEKRINYIHAIAFPNRSPAESVKLLTGKEVKNTYTKPANTNTETKPANSGTGFNLRGNQ
jgi:predicted small lipoprotein YifL